MVRKASIALLLTLAGAVMVAGLVRLFMLDLSRGDVWPVYSSFRSDPLGVKAFYESLKSMPGTTVTRNTEPLERMDPAPARTIFFCGAATSRDQEKTVAVLEQVISEGSRVVIAFYPSDNSDEIQRMLDELRPDVKDGSTGEKKDKGPGDNPDDTPWKSDLVSIEDRWGFEYAHFPSDGSSAEDGEADGDAELPGPAAVSAGDGETDLARTLPWHSDLYFDKPVDAWRVLYTREGRAVVMERKWGAGSIVLAGDSYFLSNEALRMDRNAAVLAWLVGPNNKVVFDEAHLGVELRPGIMTLIRRYRLTGLLAALAVTALVFVWKNAASLTPKRDPGPGPGEVDGETIGGAAVLANLLRRSVPGRQLPRVCLEEWERSFPRETGLRRRIEEIVARAETEPGKDRDPVTVYRAASKIVNKGKRHGGK